MMGNMRPCSAQINSDNANNASQILCAINSLIFNTIFSMSPAIVALRLVCKLPLLLLADL